MNCFCFNFNTKSKKQFNKIQSLIFKEEKYRNMKCYTVANHLLNKITILEEQFYNKYGRNLYNKYIEELRIIQR